MHCKHFGVCGGCSLPGVPYGEQLARKQGRLADLLNREVPPVLPSPAIAGFRQKVAFVFGSEPHSGRLLMGHYARGSQRIVPIEECPVHSTRGNRVAFALKDCLARAGIGAADTRGGILRHLIVRTTENDAEAVAVLVVTRNDRSLRAPVRALLESADRPEGFFININDTPGPYMIGRRTIRIDGRSHVRETGIVCARPRAAADARRLEFLVSPTAFFQTNVAAARELVRMVTDGVGAAKTVLDLYCGSGLFALPIAVGGARVTAIEDNRQAVEDLKANLKRNRIHHGRVRTFSARVEDILPRLSGERWDAVVLDPPRDGCAPEVLATVFERIAPDRAVYVSCNPEALGRELPSILKSGYRIEQLEAVDMFPHTEHIETVVVLRRLRT